MQSEIFAAKDADEYFERNKSNFNTFIAQYILSHLTEEYLSTCSLASFGIGSGYNLIELEKYVKCLHGFDVSAKSITNFISNIGPRYDGQRVFVEKSNICAPLKFPTSYDIVVYDWFSYLVTNDELERARANLLSILNKDGLIIIHDFLARSCRDKPDSHNQKLRIFKRDLAFWLAHFDQFDLLSFNVFDCERYYHYIKECRVAQIDPITSASDDSWVFIAVLKLRNK